MDAERASHLDTAQLRRRSTASLVVSDPFGWGDGSEDHPDVSCNSRRSSASVRRDAVVGDEEWNVASRRFIRGVRWLPTRFRLPPPGRWDSTPLGCGARPERRLG
jgi:hypothetical protein